MGEILHSSKLEAEKEKAAHIAFAVRIRKGLPTLADGGFGVQLHALLACLGVGQPAAFGIRRARRRLDRKTRGDSGSPGRDYQVVLASGGIVTGKGLHAERG